MNTSTNSRGSMETESEMMPQEPPPWIIRSAAWVLLSSFVVALLLAIAMRLPETVQCPFILIPSTGADPIQAAHQGVISRVSVSEGQTVKRGDELFVLRSDEIHTLDTELRTLSEDLRIKLDGLARTEAAYHSQLNIKRAEIEQAQSEVKFRENHSKTSKNLVDRMEKLGRQGGVSEVELMKMRLEAAGSEKDLSVSQRTLQQTNLERERMESEYAKLRGEQQADIEKLKLRTEALKADLENAQQNLLTVRSPYNGVVISVEQGTVGSVVQHGQVLCQLAQQDARIRARLLLKEAGFPKLAVAQKVRYFFEAFPYQRYGAISGKLDWISPSAISSSDGPHFIGLGSLEKTTIPGGAGQALALRVGMKGEAHVVIGGRTLIEYAFEPIRQLRENLSQ
ncbi:MAG TPA: HlyD family efflux transporter periplasmic adaptor subunit [Chthoniobacterales bacterium]|jgi:multidrug efflux pump subunit AcrA (membrane-fusion protein)|nr:HlyD family efflux transporter periplasmic adaptor subunit [Chthoniobacterales bacterium]